MSIAEKITGLRAALPQHVELIAVSKTYPPSAVLEAYRAGQRASEKTARRNSSRSTMPCRRTSDGIRSAACNPIKSNTSPRLSR